eukprot:TRINITY_DN10898_c0_g1_i1.p1 TRINITY_DN10898_c0_g1~~TRINITY_DN10898_c0_g1_i1.p1  ORF type:complete len:289 (+),score=36.53 TRINITY_DN10898_c0_g1_i1:230-1096(+)
MGRVALPLFRRYHALAASRCKGELMRLGFRVVPPTEADAEADVLHLEAATDVAGNSDDAAVAVARGLAKAVDGNYWVGVEVGGDGFAGAAAGVAAAVRRRAEGGEAEYVAMVEGACLPPTRWTLCLCVLRCFSPADLAAVEAVLHTELPRLGAAALRLQFDGLRALGPTKLAATLAPEAAAAARAVAAALHGRLAKFAATQKPVDAAHVSLVKFSYPLGDKARKAASVKAAGRLGLHKVDWAADPEARVIAALPPLAAPPAGLYEIHPGGGVEMGAAQYVSVWPSAAG